MASNKRIPSGWPTMEPGDNGPDFKDQVRSVKPPPRQQQHQQQLPTDAHPFKRNEDSALQQQQQQQPSQAQQQQVPNVDGHGEATDIPIVPGRLIEQEELAPEDLICGVRKRIVWALALIAIAVLGSVVAVVVVVLKSKDTGGSTSSDTGGPTTEDTKLTAVEGSENDNFGRSVAIDGQTIVVGAIMDDYGVGKVYIFTRTGTNWDAQPKLTASDAAAGDQFGVSVAINGDTMVVGAHLDDVNGTDSGSAYVFTRMGMGTTWTEQAKLTPSDGAAEDYFGRSVGIAGDTIVVGSWQDDDNGANSGSVYVYMRNGTVWTEQAKLLASDGESGDQFGRSLAIANDTIVVGAFGDQDNGRNSGSAYIFTCMETTWTEQAKLTASNGAPGDRFGTSVAIADDTIVVGANFAGDSSNRGTNSGMALVFTRSEMIWTEKATLTASDGAADDEFGASVAIAGDTIVVGARNDRDNGPNSGTAFVFMRTGLTWTEQAKLTASDGAAGDRFGYSVAMAVGTVVVGAPEKDDNVNGVDTVGSTYIYDLN